MAHQGRGPEPAVPPTDTPPGAVVGAASRRVGKTAWGDGTICMKGLGHGRLEYCCHLPPVGLLAEFKAWHGGTCQGRHFKAPTSREMAKSGGGDTQVA